MTTRPAGAPAARPGTLVTLVAVAAVAINLRLVMSGVPPLVDAIAGDLRLSATAVGALTTLPVLCMGLFAPAASRLGSRIGPQRAVLVALALLGGGALLRLGGHQVALLYAGTVTAGLGVAIAGTLLPSLVKSLFPPQRVGSATSYYFLWMMVGAGVAAAAAAPLATAFGGWTGSLGAWAAPAALGAVCWLPVVRAARARGHATAPAIEPGATVPAPAAARLPWRHGTARLLAAYFVVQSWQFFSSLAWLAPSYVASGWSRESAGYLLSAFLAGQLLGGLVGPALTDRVADHRAVMVCATACAATGFIGIFVAPTGLPWLWVALLGIGQGAAFAVGLTLLVRYAASPAASARLSAMCFLLGYTTAAAGPAGYGALHDRTGSFHTGWGTLAALMIVQTVLGLALRPGLARVP